MNLTNPENFLHYHLKPTLADCTPALRLALNALRLGETNRLIFPRDEYHFYADEAEEKFCFVSNNSEGLKRIAFPLTGIRNAIIDGSGSRFIFHGRICPFHLDACQQVTIRNITIDYERTTFSQGEIIECTDQSISIRLPPEDSYFFQNGRIWFDGPNYLQGSYGGPYHRRDAYVHTLEFDAKRREPAFMARDCYRVPAHSFSETPDGLLKLNIEYPTPKPHVGNILAITHDHRDLFGICLNNCEKTTLESIVIHHAGAMGIIAQRSTDIHLVDCVVEPPPRHNRIVSTFADATHFVNCRGKISIRKCQFRNMMDDGVNVHGIYSPIKRIISPTEILIENAHHEQAGIQVVDANEEAQVICNHSLLPKGFLDIKSVTMINRYHWLVELNKPLPEGTQPGDCLESLHNTPDVNIEYCQFSSNRARGILATTPGKIRITNNYFHSAGSAIKIAGDANSWYESGSVKDVCIQNNQFQDCGYGIWGTGIIAIDPEIRPENHSNQAYHENIRIENNCFFTFHKDLIFARCVQNMVVQHNQIESSQNYPPKQQTFDYQKLVNCTNVASQFS
ncbi:alpha-1,3-galactosidase-related protein [Cerasicoccus arenae]|nr:right-handed parallel beta-helix repeat-containing protein [Cerasicoccus arenae]MBK1859600.1 right-handed parallel beta-helix repeat-containing protein [Cerasicoccus arenae]